MPLDEVHAEADRLEHVLSGGARGANRRCARLPDPRPARRSDPRRGRFVSTAVAVALGLGPGDTTVVRVPDRDADLLRYLGELALVPGSAVEVVAQAPFDGPITLRSGSGEHAIARELAADVAIA